MAKVGRVKRGGYAVRLSTAERLVMQAGAAAAGENLSAFIRRAGMETALKELAPTPRAERVERAEQVQR